MINEFDEDIEDNKRVLMFLELIKATQREGQGPPVIHLFYFWPFYKWLSNFASKCCRICASISFVLNFLRYFLYVLLSPFIWACVNVLYIWLIWFWGLVFLLKFPTKSFKRQSFSSEVISNPRNTKIFSISWIQFLFSSSYWTTSNGFS